MALSAQEIRQKYVWLDGTEFSLVLVDNRSPEEALRLMVPTPTIAMSSASEVQSWATTQSSPSVVDAERRDDWTVLTDFGFTALRDTDRLRELSVGGRVATLDHTPYVQGQFMWWVDGELVRKTYPDVMTDLVAPAFTGEPLPEESGLPFEKSPGLGFASACEVIERLTGIEIREDILFSGSIAVGIE